jgi:hypothetical protein
MTHSIIVTYRRWKWPAAASGVSGIRGPGRAACPSRWLHHGRAPAERLPRQACRHRQAHRPAPRSFRRDLGPTAQVSGSTRRQCGVLWTAGRAGDHLGTTRYACGRTIRRSPPAMCARLNASELRRRQLPRSGGQGVAGSNPAVPTQVRRLIRSLGWAFCRPGDQDRRPRVSPDAP